MKNSYDAIVIGSGPGGSVAAMCLAREGFSVCMLEKSQQPRFHIGESMLPRMEPLLQELGLSEKVRKLPHLVKLGAEFGFGHCDKSTFKFTFQEGLFPQPPIFNIERAHLDSFLAAEAVASGAELRTETPVRSITRLAEGAVTVTTDSGEIQGRVLIDASGHGTVVARHLGLKKIAAQPELHKVAYFAHFENVEHLPGEMAGAAGIFMSDEGWFWVIGLAPGKTSIGFVTSPTFAKSQGIPPTEMLRWAIARCPAVRHRTRDARWLDTAGHAPGTNHVLSDFSYTCGPSAGPGYFLVGDAGCFLDPIFSTGVTLAMVGGQQAAKHVAAIFRKQEDPVIARKAYSSYVSGSTAIFWKIIRKYYTHAFRELFVNGTGPLQVHKAMFSVLGGQVFPRPVWALRWRLALFFFFRRVQEFVPLVTRRPHFSLLAQPAHEVLDRFAPDYAGEAAAELAEASAA